MTFINPNLFSPVTNLAFLPIFLVSFGNMCLFFFMADCCGPETVLKRHTEGCHCVYPIKLDILLLNVSSSPNWNQFLQQFATQLGLRVSQIELINFYLLSLSRLNISMDITPHTGISFSSSEASIINSSLSRHKVHLDPKLVGGYELLNLTWFKSVAPAPGRLLILNCMTLSIVCWKRTFQVNSCLSKQL